MMMIGKLCLTGLDNMTINNSRSFKELISQPMITDHLITINELRILRQLFPKSELKIKGPKLQSILVIQIKQP